MIWLFQGKMMTGFGTVFQDTIMENVDLNLGMD